jgi:hypothetical protein
LIHDSWYIREDVAGDAVVETIVNAALVVGGNREVTTAFCDSVVAVYAVVTKNVRKIMQFFSVTDNFHLPYHSRRGLSILIVT